MEKEHSRPPSCPFFPQTTGISNTERSLVGQQGNMAHGTHIMVFHQSLKINTIQKNTHPCLQISPKTPAQRWRGALQLLFAVEKKQDSRL